MKSNLFYRHADLQARNANDRGLTLSFSSEAPVTRWFGTEILLHNPGNVDLTRLQAVGSLIYGHDSGKIENILGRIDRVWLEDRRGHAEIKMDTDPAGQAALVKIKSGSIRGISVGYMIDQARQLEDKDTWTDPDSGQSFDGPAMIATRWVPYEISLTPIPADATVGIGREATRSLDGIHITTTQRKETTKMDNETIKALATAIIESAKDTEKTRRDLIGYGRMIGPEAASYAENAIKEGRKIEEIQRTLLDMAGIVPGGRLNQNGRITSFKQISDDEFYRALTDPAPNSLDAGGPATQGGIRSFNEISDEDFFAGLTNPAQYGGK